MYRFNENSDVLEIEFVRVDDKGRPVFKPVDKRKKYYLADLSHLFDYDTKEEEIIKFYKDFDDLNKFIVFKGYSVDAEPEGNEIIKELRLVRKTKKNESLFEEKCKEIKTILGDDYELNSVNFGKQPGYKQINYSPKNAKFTYSVDGKDWNDAITKLKIKIKNKNESKRKLNEEYGEYKGYPEIEYIADKIEGGNQFGYEPYMFGSWELKAYLDGSDDLFARNSNLTDNMQDYLAEQISYPVRYGHISYNGLDIIIHSGSGVSKEDLLSLDPNHDLFDEKDIDEMLNDESSSKEIEFWIDYEVDYKEDIESDEEDLNESKIRIDEDVLKILNESDEDYKKGWHWFDTSKNDFGLLPFDIALIGSNEIDGRMELIAFCAKKDNNPQERFFFQAFTDFPNKNQEDYESLIGDFVSFQDMVDREIEWQETQNNEHLLFENFTSPSKSLIDVVEYRFANIEKVESAIPKL